MKRKVTLRTAFLATLILFALLVVIPCIVRAEEIPTKGTFEGIYHRDRWGVGHFNYYIVHSDLDKELSPYEGERIRLEVTKAEQPMNPGPAIILEIGEITTLPVSPLEVELSTIPEDISGSSPFQILCILRNMGEIPLTVKISDVMICIHCPREVKDADEPSWLNKCYTRGQLWIDNKSIQMYQAIVKTSTGEYGNLSNANTIVIPLGDFFPLVVIFDKGSKPGEYEVEASAKGKEGEKWLKETRTWLKFDVYETELSQDKQVMSLPLKNKKVETDDEGYTARCVFLPTKGEKRRIVQCGKGKLTAWSGRIRAFTKKGVNVPLKVEQPHSRSGEPEPWQLIKIPEEGIKVHTKFRKRTWFSEQAIDHIVLDILTDRGVESHTLVKRFKDPHMPKLPVFGEPVSGVKIRVRPAKPAFEKDEPIRFYVQAVNVSKKPVRWWMPIEDFGENIQLELDGKVTKFTTPKAQYIYGWAAQHTCKTPDEWSVTLPKNLKPKTKGKHTFRYSIISKGGANKNANGNDVPLIAGQVYSNTVTFELK